MARVDKTMTFMRFLTPEWRDGELTDEQYERAVADYEKTLQSVRAALPAEMQQFLESSSLHDALVRKASLDRDRTFRLALRSGDLQSGYMDVDLEYRQVEELRGLPSVEAVLDDANAEIIAHEVDVLPDGSLEHRFLFAPEGEIRIHFRAFGFTVAPVASRESERS
ncbi:MAG TPA: hypothetical protein VE010_23290 [Thermoanaerobaculia bacterium]|nr:hypothetical protein [Thermoanaerobaculia bacterium]